MPTDFALWLRKCLQKLRSGGISQSDLADVIGVDKQTVSSWKLGRTVPRRATRRRAERIVGELLAGDQASSDGGLEVAETATPYEGDSTLVRLNPEELSIIQSIRRMTGKCDHYA